MSWFLLLLAGALEVCWAVGLKYTHGFTRPLPSLLVAGSVAASLFLLALAVRTLPIGTAYAVWVGIGAVGAALAGILLHGEPITPARALFLGLLLLSLIGLKLSAPTGQ